MQCGDPCHISLHREFTDAQRLINGDVRFLFGFLINDSFDTLSNEHQVSHIFMSNRDIVT